MKVSYKPALHMHALYYNTPLSVSTIRVSNVLTDNCSVRNLILQFLLHTCTVIWLPTAIATRFNMEAITRPMLNFWPSGDWFIQVPLETFIRRVSLLGSNMQHVAERPQAGWSLSTSANMGSTVF